MFDGVVDRRKVDDDDEKVSWFSRKRRGAIPRKNNRPPFGRGFSRHLGLSIRYYHVSLSDLSRVFLQGHILLHHDRQDVVHPLKPLFEGSDAMLLAGLRPERRHPVLEKLLLPAVEDGRLETQLAA